MMRGIRAGIGCVALAAATTVSCDRTDKPAPVAGNLTAPADAPAPETSPAGTSGSTASAPVEPAGPSAPAGPAAGPAAESDASAPRAAYRTVTIPAGTVLTVRLNTPVASDTSRVEQRVDGTLARDVRVGGVEALGAGATLRGTVTNAERSGRVKGRANVAFKFDHIAANGTVYPVSTRTISRVAPGTKKRDAATIGLPAAGGAIVGGIIGGGDGAVKGGVIGGAAGTAAVLSTRGKEVRLARGTTVSVRLASPLTVRVPMR